MNSESNPGVLHKIQRMVDGSILPPPIAALIGFMEMAGERHARG